MIRLLLRSWTIKRLLVRTFPTRVYDQPLSLLPPERTYPYHDSLLRTRGVAGAVVEVGCYLGGTTATAARLLRNVGSARRYVAVDTFGGFVPDQFDHDVELGTRSDNRRAFSANSRNVVERLLRHWGAPEVELVEADIVTLDADRLPGRVSVALIDVDLAAPVHAALERLWPRLAPGGVILVDDCVEPHPWAGALTAYKQFVAEQGLQPEFVFGMGILRAPTP